MIRTALLAAALGAPLLVPPPAVVVPPVPRPSPAPAQPAAQVVPGLGLPMPGFCGNSLPHEPVVVYEVTGGTLAGFLHVRFTAYSDGSASASSLSSFGGGESVADAAVSFPGPEAVAELLAELRAAGAFQLCDQDLIVSDLPLSTLTVLAPGSDARAHSSSYWSAEGPWAAPSALVNAFLQAHFPNLGHPGS